MANNEEVDWESLSDEDFMNTLESIEQNSDDIETGSEEPEESQDEEQEYIEDTDQEDTEDEDIETDDEDHADEEDTEVETEENTQEDNIDNENSGSEESETEPPTDGENTEDNNEETKELNYQEEYKKILEEKQRYEDFYNQVTGEFVANGKKIRGFDDPKKIIEAQQMAAGFSDKMAAFKPYRPFMKTLKEKGILDNPEKFNFAMSLLDGDKEAMKKHLKELDIDPMEMDLDEINYQEKNQLPNNIELALDDLMDNAAKSGVDKQVMNVINNEWDDNSVVELLNDPQSTSDLVSHISSGAYDVVKERMMQKRMTDVNGVYNNMPAIEQYKEAAAELENEYMTYVQQQQAYEQQQAMLAQQNSQQPQQNQPDMQNQPIAQEQTKVNEARRKASSLSKKKKRTTQNKKVIDPLTDLNDEQFTEYLDSIIYQ